MKCRADFKVGDMVTIDNPIHEIGKTRSFEPKRIGPYLISKKVGDLNYELKSPFRKSNLVHYNRLNEYKIRNTSASFKVTNKANDLMLPVKDNLDLFWWLLIILVHRSNRSNDDITEINNGDGNEDGNNINNNDEENADEERTLMVDENSLPQNVSINDIDKVTNLNVDLESVYGSPMEVAGDDNDLDDDEVDLSDYVICEYCSNRFKRRGLARHLNFCKNKPALVLEVGMANKIYE